MSKVSPSFLKERWHSHALGIKITTIIFGLLLAILWANLHMFCAKPTESCCISRQLIHKLELTAGISSEAE